jgi:hypothetical protein
LPALHCRAHGDNTSGLQDSAVEKSRTASTHNTVVTHITKDSVTQRKYFWLLLALHCRAHGDGTSGLQDSIYLHTASLYFMSRQAV